MNAVMPRWRKSQDTLSCENSHSLHVVERTQNPETWAPVGYADNSGYADHTS